MNKQERSPRRPFRTLGMAMLSFGQKLFRTYTPPHAEGTAEPSRMPPAWRSATESPLVWQEPPDYVEGEFVDDAPPENYDYPGAETSPAPRPRRQPVQRQTQQPTPPPQQAPPRRQQQKQDFTGSPLDNRLQAILQRHKEVEAERDQIREQKRAHLTGDPVQREDEGEAQPRYRRRRGQLSVDYVETSALKPSSDAPEAVQRNIDPMGSETEGTPPDRTLLSIDNAAEDDVTAQVVPSDTPAPDSVSAVQPSTVQREEEMDNGEAVNLDTIAEDEPDVPASASYLHDLQRDYYDMDSGAAWTPGLDEPVPYDEALETDFGDETAPPEMPRQQSAPPIVQRTTPDTDEYNLSDAVDFPTADDTRLEHVETEQSVVYPGDDLFADQPHTDEGWTEPPSAVQTSGGVQQPWVQRADADYDTDEPITVDDIGSDDVDPDAWMDALPHAGTRPAPRPPSRGEVSAPIQRDFDEADDEILPEDDQDWLDSLPSASSDEPLSPPTNHYDVPHVQRMDAESDSDEVSTAYDDWQPVAGDPIDEEEWIGNLPTSPEASEADVPPVPSTRVQRYAEDMPYADDPLFTDVDLADDTPNLPQQSAQRYEYESDDVAYTDETSFADDDLDDYADDTPDLPQQTPTPVQRFEHESDGAAHTDETSFVDEDFADDGENDTDLPPQLFTPIQRYTDDDAPYTDELTDYDDAAPDYLQQSYNPAQQDEAVSPQGQHTVQRDHETDEFDYQDDEYTPVDDTAIFQQHTSQWIDDDTPPSLPRNAPPADHTERTPRSIQRHIDDEPYPDAGTEWVTDTSSVDQDSVQASRVERDAYSEHDDEQPYPSEAHDADEPEEDDSGGDAFFPVESSPTSPVQRFAADDTDDDSAYTLDYFEPEADIDTAPLDPHALRDAGYNAAFTDEQPNTPAPPTRDTGPQQPLVQRMPDETADDEYPGSWHDATLSSPIDDNTDDDMPPMDVFEALWAAGVVPADDYDAGDDTYNPYTPGMTTPETGAAHQSVQRTDDEYTETEDDYADDMDAPDDQPMDLYNALVQAGAVQSRPSDAVQREYEAPDDETDSYYDAHRSVEDELIEILNLPPHSQPEQTRVDEHSDTAQPPSRQEPPPVDVRQPTPPQNIMRVLEDNPQPENNEDEKDVQNINIDQLAREVYNKLRNRLRIERERGGKR